MSREWRFYISDMIEFSEKVLAYTHEMEQSSIIQTDIPTLLHNLHMLKAAANAGQITDPAA